MTNLVLSTALVIEGQCGDVLDDFAAGVIKFIRQGVITHDNPRTISTENYGSTQPVIVVKFNDVALIVEKDDTALSLSRRFWDQLNARAGTR